MIRTGQLVACFVVLSLASCQTQSHPRIQVVGTNGHQAQVTIDDEVGAISGVAVGAPRTLLSRVSIIQAEADPVDPTGLFVAWVMTPCEEKATLTLATVRGDLYIEVVPEFIEAGCDAIGVAYGVRLAFNRPIDPSKIAVAMRNGGELLSEASPTH